MLQNLRIIQTSFEFLVSGFEKECFDRLSTNGNAFVTLFRNSVRPELVEGLTS